MKTAVKAFVILGLATMSGAGGFATGYQYGYYDGIKNAALLEQRAFEHLREAGRIRHNAIEPPTEGF